MIAAIALEAFAAKYRPALGSRAHAGLTAVIASAFADGRDGLQLVAELDGRPAGVVHMIVGAQGGRPAVLPALAAAVGRPAAIRAVAVFALLAPPPTATDTARVDELAVAPWARRRGVARALLHECARRARAEGRTRLELMVSADNAPAVRLYESEGFAVVRRRRWFVRRLVFGAPGALIMARPLGPGSRQGAQPGEHVQ